MSLKGMIEGKLGHFKEAFADFRSGIALAQDYGLKSQIALLYNNYGFWARDYGAVDQSIEFFTTAAKIDTDLKSRAAIVFDNRNMGLSIILKGDFNRARDLLKQALAESEELHQVYNAAYCNFGLGDNRHARTKWSDAEGYFQRALVISQQGYMQDFVWRAEAGIGAAARKQKHMQAAEESYGKAVKVIESMRAGLQSEDSRSGYFSDAGVQETYSGYASLLMELGQGEDAWTMSERSRSRAFIDALGAQKMNLVKAGVKNGTQLADFDQVKTIDKKELSALLGPNTVVVEYHITADELLIWVLSNGQIHGKSVPIAASDLKSRVREFRELMENYSTTDYLGKELTELLLEPVREYLVGAKRLAIIPYGTLNFYRLQRCRLTAQAKLTKRLAD